MYCKKCGTELPDNAKHCMKCGAEIAGSIHISASRNLFKPQYVVFSILTICCFMLLLFSPTVSVHLYEKGYIDETLKLPFSAMLKELESDLATTTIFNTVIYIIVAIVLVLPLLLKKAVRSVWMYPARFALIWTCAYYIVFLLFCRDQYADSPWYIVQAIDPTFWGILLVLMSLGTLIYSFVLSNKIKKIKRFKSSRNCKR